MEMSSEAIIDKKAEMMNIQVDIEHNSLGWSKQESLP